MEAQPEAGGVMRLDEHCACDDRVYAALPLFFKRFIAFVCPNCKCLVTTFDQERDGTD